MKEGKKGGETELEKEGRKEGSRVEKEGRKEEREGEETELEKEGRKNE